MRAQVKRRLEALEEQAGMRTDRQGVRGYARVQHWKPDGTGAVVRERYPVRGTTEHPPAGIIWIYGYTEEEARERYGSDDETPGERKARKSRRDPENSRGAIKIYEYGPGDDVSA